MVLTYSSLRSVQGLGLRNVWGVLSLTNPRMLKYYEAYQPFAQQHRTPIALATGVPLPFVPVALKSARATSWHPEMGRCNVEGALRAARSSNLRRK